MQRNTMMRYAQHNLASRSMPPDLRLASPAAITFTSTGSWIPDPPPSPHGAERLEPLELEHRVVGVFASGENLSQDGQVVVGGDLDVLPAHRR